MVNATRRVARSRRSQLSMWRTWIGVPAILAPPTRRPYVCASIATPRSQVTASSATSRGSARSVRRVTWSVRASQKARLPRSGQA